MSSEKASTLRHIYLRSLRVSGDNGLLKPRSRPETHDRNKAEQSSRQVGEGNEERGRKRGKESEMSIERREEKRGIKRTGTDESDCAPHPCQQSK